MNEPISILLIEDNPGDMRLIREMLHEPGGGVTFQLYIAGTLQEGLARISEVNLDVILLDLSLPDSFGVETLVKVREQAASTAIVVLTGFDNQALGVQAVQVGAQDYLIKGDTESKLLVRAIRYAIERERSDAAIRRSEENYRSLITDVFNTSAVAVLILDRNFIIVWLNEATEKYFGVKRENVLGKDKRFLIDNELKCMFADPDDYASKLLKAYEENSFTERFECHILPEGDREDRWLEHWSQPIHAGVFAGGRIEQYTDITNRKEYEEAQRELVTLQERQRIARELHDSVSQLLFTCSAMSEAALRQWKVNPDRAQELMTEAHQLVTSALVEMRVLLLELRPASLAGVSLKNLFEQLLLSLKTRRQVEISMALDEVPLLPPNVQMGLYRITQEALNNIVKHARATQITVSARDYADRVEMDIHDNGRGFDRQNVRPTSLGLGIMQERAAEIGATIMIESQAGQGTRINVIWTKSRG